MGQIVRMARERLKKGGRLVANVSSLDNVLSVRQSLEGAGKLALRMIQIAHDNDQLERLTLEGMNPTFLISFIKAD